MTITTRGKGTEISFLLYCRFYEAVVRLPSQKAQALDPTGDAFNSKIDPTARDRAIAQREQCYEIVTNAIRSLKGDTGQKGSILDPASRNRYIRQIIQLSVQWPDTAFHEHLYRNLIELGLETELLEYGGPDLVSFLQTAGRKPSQEVLIFSSCQCLYPSPYPNKYASPYLELTCACMLTYMLNRTCMHACFYLSYF